MTGTKERVSRGIEVNVETVEGREGTAVIRCKGFIDTYNSVDFTRQVQSVMDQGTKRLVFDLQNVSYVSSTGVGTFAAFLKELRSQGGNIVIADMQPKVLEVFKLLGFSRFFNATDTVDEALEFFPAGSSGRCVPYDEMVGITDSCRRLEVFVPRENQPSFYRELVALLRMIDELKSA